MIRAASESRSPICWNKTYTGMTTATGGRMRCEMSFSGAWSALTRVSMSANVNANRLQQGGGPLDFNEEELNQIGNQILGVLQGFVSPDGAVGGQPQEQRTLGQEIRASIYSGDALMNPLGKEYFTKTKADDAEYWSALGFNDEF